MKHICLIVKSNYKYFFRYYSKSIIIYWMKSFPFINYLVIKNEKRKRKLGIMFE